ncbi:hypothetical protein AAZX31_02G099800 [Glycine max]
MLQNVLPLLLPLCIAIEVGRNQWRKNEDE